MIVLNVICFSFSETAINFNLCFIHTFNSIVKSHPCQYIIFPEQNGISITRGLRSGLLHKINFSGIPDIKNFLSILQYSDMEKTVFLQPLLIALCYKIINTEITSIQNRRQAFRIFFSWRPISSSKGFYRLHSAYKQRHC